METYTVDGLSAKEVRRIGENKWFYEHLRFLIPGLTLPIVVFAIIAWALPEDFNKVGRVLFLLIPIIAFLFFYAVWIVESTKQGKAFLNKHKEVK